MPDLIERLREAADARPTVYSSLLNEAANELEALGAVKGERFLTVEALETALANARASLLRCSSQTEAG